MRTVVFFTGFVVMAAELLAARLMLPNYGDSVVVWGSVIGCFLLAMSLGYYIGGLLADRKTPFALETIIVSLAVFVALMYPLSSLALPHPLIAALVLTLVPGLCGGAIMPLVLKQDAHSLKQIGYTAGTLSAWNTIGSVLGTFAFIFVLSPELGILRTTLLLALIGAIALGFIHKWFFLLALLFPLVLFVSSPLEEQASVDVTLESPYGPVRVYDSNHTRHLVVNGGQMSEMNMSNRTQDLPYWDYLVCMERWLAGRDSVYVMGLGAGSLTLRAQERNMDVVAVDINPVVVDVAREYFGVRENQHTRIDVADGRVHLQEQGRFDLITMDVMHYNEHSYELPEHMITKEFFAQTKEHLNPGGVLIMHVLTHPEHELVQAVATTMQSEYAFVSQMDCQGSQILAASDQSLMSWPETIPVQTDGPIITDDKVPIFLQ